MYVFFNDRLAFSELHLFSVPPLTTRWFNPLELFYTEGVLIYFHRLCHHSGGNPHLLNLLNVKPVYMVSDGG